MVLVRILKPTAGEFGLAYFGGEEAEFNNEQAKLLVEAGFAEFITYVDDEDEAELPTKETAVKPTKKKETAVKK
jgi:hypothetical protein